MTGDISVDMTGPIKKIYKNFGIGTTQSKSNQNRQQNSTGATTGAGAYDGDVWSTGLSDDEVLTKARNAKNGDKFRALFDDGDLSAYENDHSRADLALVWMLSYWTGRNPEQLDRIMRTWKLFRAKWDERRGASTYGERTIGKALRERTEYFRTCSAFSADEDDGDSAHDAGENGTSSAYSAFSATEDEKEDIGPAPRFPLDVLPKVAREFVEQGAQAIGVPAEMVAIPFLANTGAVIGNTRKIEPKGGYIQPANLYAAVIAKTGTAKTPAQAYAQKPLNALQAEAYATYMDDFEDYELAVREAKKNKGTLPSPPVEEHFMSTNTTVEALGKMLTTSPGVLLAMDELSGFMADMNAYKGGKGGDRQSYLKYWNGEPDRIIRKGSGTLFIPDPAVSIIGGIQPELLSSLGTRDQQHDGFIPRFLMVMPDAPAMKWNDNVIKPGPIEDMAKVFRHLRNPKVYTGVPVRLPLSPDALAVFVEWHDENQSAVEASTGLERGFLAKYPNQCARLALILHLLRYPDDLTGPIEADTVRDAITLIEYFRASLVRILPKFKAKATPTTAGLAPRVHRILEQAGGAWMDRTAISAALSGHASAEAISTALVTLQSKGIAESQTVSTGGRPKEQWRFILPESDTDAKKAEKAEKARTSAEDIAGERPNPFRNPRRSGENPFQRRSEG